MNKEFDFMEDTDSVNYDLPSYSDPGRILVEVVGLSGSQYSKWEYDNIENDGSTFWIQEGVGIDYWLEGHCEFPCPGWYVVEGITGTYYRGTWGFDDDDEEWEYKLVRPATEEEIKNGLA